MPEFHSQNLMDMTNYVSLPGTVDALLNESREGISTHTGDTGENTGNDTNRTHIIRGCDEQDQSCNFITDQSVKSTLEVSSMAEVNERNDITSNFGNKEGEQAKSSMDV